MESIGSLEELVLIAIQTLGKQAYGIRVGSLVGAGSVGALYTTLGRLEEKELIAARKGKPTPVRGGRAKTFYRVTAQGRKALQLAELKRRRARGDLSAWGTK